jgi:RNA polymerase sigma-70 factor (ECF subfamily)
VTVDRSRRGAAEDVAVLNVLVPGGDEALLRRIQAGGPGAAALLCDRFAADVDRMVWRLLGADPEHEDVVHRVLCEVLASARRARDAAALASFVRRVVTNVVSSEIRRRRVRRMWSRFEPDPDRFEGDIEDPVARKRFSCLYAALDRMPAKERVALCMRYFEGHTIDELAEQHGCSRRTINRLLASATARFRRLAARDPELRSWVEELGHERGGA